MQIALSEETTDMEGRDFSYFKEKYTEEGARSIFEKTCFSLICKLHSNEEVHRVRPNPGDYGVDIFFGDCQSSIHVFQCKFFLGSLSKSRKEEIRKSFRTFIEKHKNIPEIHWTLCLPDTLSYVDLLWWESWKLKKEQTCQVQLELLDGDYLLNVLRETGLYNSFFDIIDKNGFEAIVKNVPPIVPSEYPFHYSCPHMSGIYGREEELQILECFLHTNAFFSFWVISGPAGVGKSKMVYYLSRMKSLSDWRFVFVPKNTVKDLSKLRECDLVQNTCLIVDYANEVSDELSDMFRQLTHYESPLEIKLRILLIAREGMRDVHSYDNEFPIWFQTILGSSRTVINRMYKQEFLSLSGIGEKDYWKLIDDYCSAFSSITLSDTEKVLISYYISTKLSDMMSKVEPIYVLFTVDAYLRDKKLTHWDKNELVKSVIDRNYEKWKMEIPNEELLSALMELLQLATIVGEWDPNTSAPKHLQKSANTVCQFIEKNINKAYIGYFSTLTGRYIYRDNHYILPSLAPDIVGEYYVLDYLNRLTAFSKNGWLSFFVEQFAACKDFFLRSIQNYGDDECFGHTIVATFQQILVYIKQNNNQDETLFEMITSLLGYYYSNFKGSSDPTIYNKLINLIDSNAERYQNRYQCWAELKIAYRYRNTEYRLYSWRLDNFPMVMSHYQRWPDSSLIAKEYISYLGNLIEDSAGRVSRIDERTEAFLSLFDAFIDKRKRYREESVSRNTLVACINVISVINQIEGAKQLSTKYSQRIQEIIKDDSSQIELMICYIENSATLLLQLAKAQNDMEIKTTIRNTKEYVEHCLVTVAYRCFWITLPIITQSIVNLCAYQYEEEAISLSNYFFELTKSEQYQSQRDYIVFRHEESAINRIFKSNFTSASVRKIFVNGSQPFIFS